MTAEYPKVQMFKQDNPIKRQPGRAGKIAVIGAFDTEEVNPVHCSNLDEAYIKLGTDKTYDGIDCLKELFYGASSILAVNITEVDTSGNDPVIDKDITVDKLTQALAKIKNEKFDSLFVCGLLSDAFISVIVPFLQQRLLNKLPAGFHYAMTRTTLAEWTITAGLFNDFSYGGVTQQFIIDGEELSLLKSGAYWAGLVAGLNVGNTMTMKQVPGVDGLNPEYVFEPVNDGYSGLDLLQLGLTTFQCLDRENDVYICVNSEQPNGYDLYINRVRDYVLREMAMHNFLGDRNRPKTLGEIEQELDRVKDECVNTLDLLENIEYHVVKKNAKCVDVYIDSLLFAGLITNINVYFTVEVE